MQSVVLRIPINFKYIIMVLLNDEALIYVYIYIHYCLYALRGLMIDHFKNFPHTESLVSLNRLF